MNLLQDYYHINENKNEFIYKNKCYQLICIDDLKEFERLYSIYLYYMNLSHIMPYTIVYNKYHQIHSCNHILFTYEQQKINIHHYLYAFIRPLPQSIYIKDIKEQWIHKSNELRKHLNKNIQTSAFIYYYTGLIEYCITLLNHILYHNPRCFIPVSLSLKHCLDNSTQLINPTSYIISSRVRHLVLLLKSQIIEVDDLVPLLNHNILTQEELYYFIACILYPHDINLNTIITLSYTKHIENINKVIKIYKKVYKVLNNKFSIVKISWLNEENML